MDGAVEEGADRGVPHRCRHPRRVDAQEERARMCRLATTSSPYMPKQSANSSGADASIPHPASLREVEFSAAAHRNFVASFGRWG
jgi:hypothetical protein